MTFLLVMRVGSQIVQQNVQMLSAKIGGSSERFRTVHR